MPTPTADKACIALLACGDRHSEPWRMLLAQPQRSGEHLNNSPLTGWRRLAAASQRNIGIQAWRYNGAVPVTNCFQLWR